MTLAERGRHDLVLLDVMLPDVDGTEVCRRLRAQGNRTPGAVPDRPRRHRGQGRRGSPPGGDDYVTKPFSLDELVARIHAVLRRTAPGRGTTTGSRSPTWRWTTRPTRCGARASLIELTATEFNLLRYMLENARRVLSKSEILDHVWTLRLRR